MADHDLGEMDFRTTSLAELSRSVRARQISARELTEVALARIERLDPVYNAFVAVDGDRALAEAAAIDERIAAGQEPGPLAGIPLGVKDLQRAIGYRTTYGSALHADDPPGPREVSHGLRDGPKTAWVVLPMKPNSGVFVLPTMTQPAARMRATKGSSTPAGGSSACSADP